MAIIRATESDVNVICGIGKLSVAESHKGSCSDEHMNEYLVKNYSNDAIDKDLSDPTNHYYIVTCNDKVAGFSKIVFNAEHLNVDYKNAAKLDRIYLLKEFIGLKLGLELLNFNIELARKNNQSCVWLYTWIGNENAINFYLKSGFKVVGEHKFYINETHYDVSHQMVLKLSQ